MSNKQTPISINNEYDCSGKNKLQNQYNPYDQLNSQIKDHQKNSEVWNFILTTIFM